MEVDNEGVQFCHLLDHVVMKICHVSLVRCPAISSTGLGSLHR